MNALLGLLSRPRFTLAIAFLLSGLGVVAWMQMPREEDPRLAQRGGIIVAPYPGADILDVERLVVQPIEDELAEVNDIEEVFVTVRGGIAIFRVILEGHVQEDDTADIWAEVRRGLSRAHSEMPSEALAPSLDDEIFNTEAILVSVAGTPDRLALRDAAVALRKALLTAEDVARVNISGDPGERIVIDFDDATGRRLGLDALELADHLRRNEATTPGGTLEADGRRLTLRPGSDWRSLEELRRLPIPIGSDGAALPLESIANVRRTIATPSREHARYQGEAAVMVGVVPSPGIQAEHFGAGITEVLDTFRSRHPELDIETIAYQPERVRTRLGELGRSLLVGVAIVAGVLLLFMGFRMGVVVASVVPLVTFASLAVYAATGGVLQQMAVAALVIALGLLVDNAIVVAETMQRRLDEGQSPKDAMTNTVKELALPLGSATGTTLASFVPMLLAVGTSGDFTRAIPVVVMLTLTVSYGYALLVTPMLSRVGLRPSRRQGPGRLDALAGRLGHFATAHPWLTLASCLLFLGGAASLAPQVRRNFFPTSDRNQAIVQMELPEGTHIDTTDAAARRLESWLARRPEVVDVTAFIGRSSPAFYYNLPRRPGSPHLAQFVVNTEHAGDVDPLRRAVQEFARRSLPDALVIAKRLEQGPPIPAPVELRLYGDDLDDLYASADRIRAILRQTEGTELVRVDYGPGAPTLRFAIDDAAAGRHGVDRDRIALSVLGHAHGLPVGTFRAGEEPAPVLLRSGISPRHRGGEGLPPELLSVSDVARPGHPPLPLTQVSEAEVQWLPAVLFHRNRQRIARVFAETTGTATYQSVLSEAMPELEALELPEGIRLEVGGAAHQSAKANKSLGAKAPIAALLLIAILLAEFNSFRRVLIVLATAPLAALGIWPGLFLLDLPFGFVALLGAIALIGIAVNGAIVLIDVTEQRRKEGMNIADALREAVRLRTRPILLTTATTVAGLVPLLASESTLWPPMAAAMISGLIIATLLTLGVVPALYRLLFRDSSDAAPKAALPKAAALTAIALALFSVPAQAQTPTQTQTQREAPSFDLEAALRGEGTGLHRSEAVSRGVARSHRLQGAQANLSRAQDNLRQGRQDLYPQLDVSARYTRIAPVNNDPLVAAPEGLDQASMLLPQVDDNEARILLEGLYQGFGNLGSARIQVPENQYALRAHLSYPVSAVFLQVLPALDALEEGEAAAEAQQRTVAADVALQLEELYLRWAQSRALLALAQHRLLQREDQHRRVEAAIENGQRARVDALRTRALVAAARGALRQQQAAVEASEYALRTLIDWQGPMALGDDLSALPEAPASLDDCIAQALRDRPESAALRALARARGAAARAHRGAAFPVLALDAAADYANPNRRFVPQRTRFDASWDVSVVLSWSPNGAARALHQAAGDEEARLEAEAQLRAFEEGVRIEVSQARATLIAARRGTEDAAVAAGAANEAYAAQRRAYDLGQVPLGDVIDADVELTTSQIRRIEAAIAAHRASAQLRRALGAASAPR